MGTHVSFTADLLKSTFEDWVTRKFGREVGRLVVQVIVDKQIETGIEIGGLSQLLRKQCPSFCSIEDVTLYKGMELMHQASSNDIATLTASLKYLLLKRRFMIF